MFRKKVFKKPENVKLKSNQKIYLISAIFIFLISNGIMFNFALTSQQRANYWVAQKPIPIGQTIQKEDVTYLPLDLNQSDSRYLKQSQEIIGLTTLDSLKPGEIIEKEKVGKQNTFRNVALRIPNGHLPPSLEVNDFVDIWFTDSLNSKSNILIPKINVVWIDDVDTNFGGVSTVVLSIPDIQVSNLINFSRSESLDLVQIEN